jgi:thiol-disulfide isomerase/thioredoxin
VRRRLIWFAVLLVVAATVVLVVRLGSSETSRGSAAGDGSSLDLVQQYPPAERAGVEPFEATTLAGAEISRVDLEGRVVLVNVWGSWCGPCRVEAPHLAEVAAEYSEEYGDEVLFLGVNVRDSPDAARAFERSFGIPYDSVHPDDSAQVLPRFGTALTTAAVPVTLVLDTRTRVASRVLGAVDASTLRALLDEALAEGFQP